MLSNQTISLPADNSVCCRFWGDECVVYHQITASTHLVDGVGALIFGSVVKGASRQAELLENLHNSFELPNDFDIESFLNQLISDYQALGLLIIMEDHGV